jgi:hypothetical protein
MSVLRAPVLLSGLAAMASLCLACGPASAQSDAVAPAPAPSDASAVIAQPQAASAANDSVDQQIAAWTQSPNGDGSNAPAGGPAPPRQIHGEAGVAFGSSGYRSGYISTDIPIGKDSDLGIAVGDTEFKPKHFGKVSEKSLAISLRIGGGDLGAPINCGSPTMAMDGRYLEPVWLARQRGEALARDQASCAGPAVDPMAGPPQGAREASE